MNVCLISEAGSFGGAEVHTLQLLRGMVRRGHTVTVIECANEVLKGHWSPPADAVKFLSVPLSTDGRSVRDLMHWRKVLRAAGGERAIFIKNWNRRGALPFLLALRRSFRQVCFIEHLEADPMPRGTAGRYFGFIPRPGLWRQRERLRRWLPSLLTDRVVAVSEKVRDRLIRDCHYPPHKVVVARNGVAWQDFMRNAQIGAAFRATLAIPSGRRLITLLARLEHAKGIDIALQAMAQLRHRNIPVHLLIAGTGSLERQLKAQADALSLNDVVTFAGFLADPKPALWASDVILFSSRLEGLPLGLLEGMAAGCVPVVTRISGMPEVVTSSDLGWVVEAENPSALAGAIAEMSALDEARMAVLRQRAAEHIRINFDLERAQERLLAQIDFRT